MVQEQSDLQQFVHIACAYFIHLLNLLVSHFVYDLSLRLL